MGALSRVFMTREQFAIPTFRSMGLGDSAEPVTYLCGNSLGLMPLEAKDNVDAELAAWAGQGVEGHHSRQDGRDPWVTNDEAVAAKLADLVFGAKKSEISFTGTLTANLNALLQAFYRPTAGRYKLLCERKAFPSDIYAFQNQVKLQGYAIEDALVLLDPPEHSDLITTEQILQAIEQHKDSLALVLLPGIQFYTGQYFDIPRITAKTHEVGAVSGWDLAHASGNVPLRLHDWGCDFAVFCSYKYLNCGPGNMGGLFVHEKTAAAMQDEPRAAGWWGVDVATRFDMEFAFKPAQGARGFAQSNVCLFGPACMLASLNVFAAAGGVQGLAERRQVLTGSLAFQLMASPYYKQVFHIMTDVNNGKQGMLALDRGLDHGSQISIKFTSTDPEFMPKVVERLTKKGIIGDERKPNVLRLAPSPLYNTEKEVDYAAKTLNEVIAEVLN